MRRLLGLALFGVMLLLSSCGQDSVTSTGAVPPPPMVAPPPPGYSGVPSSPGGTYFTPYMPPGYPAQYYPFLPIDNYFRQSPQMTSYWYQVWSNWQNVASSYGISPYDFSTFYYDYLPQLWNSGGYQNLYNYFNQNFYSWMSPQYQFSSSVSYTVFWQYYQYMPYSYDVCGCSF